MPRRITLAFLLLVPVLEAGCSVFDDPTPETVSLLMTGAAGTLVQIVYSRDFVAGVDEQGVTRVQLFGTDTVRQALPLDTVISIAVDHRIFVEVMPLETDQTTVELKVDIDDRNILRDTGNIFAADPWRWVYLYNHQLTRVVDVVF